MNIRKILLSAMFYSLLAMPAMHLAGSEINGLQNAKKVCIVPGHDSRRGSGGCVGKAGSESEIALKISSTLEKKLRDDGLFVFRTRTGKGYADPLMKTVKRNFNELKYKTYGNPKKYTYAKNKFDYPLILLGIAKHVSDGKFDLMVNIHMNKASHNREKTRGFCIYYSENNLRADDSAALAYYLHESLKEGGFKVSNNSEELEGVKARGDLILIGNHRAILEVPSVLVECGYIDEIKFSKPGTRIKMAECIRNGIKDYLSGGYR